MFSACVHESGLNLHNLFCNFLRLSCCHKCFILVKWSRVDLTRSHVWCTLLNRFDQYFSFLQLISLILVMNCAVIVCNESNFFPSLLVVCPQKSHLKCARDRREKLHCRNESSQRCWHRKWKYFVGSYAFFGCATFPVSLKWAFTLLYKIRVIKLVLN